VTVGERIGSDWIISKGLQPGDKVIAEGTQKVRQGMTVNPKPFAPAKQRPPTSLPRRHPGSQGVSRHVQVLHQPADRGHGHLDPDDHHRLVAMSGLPTRSSRTSCRHEIKVTSTYTGADALTRRTGRGHADRAADVRRRQHELHVFDQRQQRPVDPDVNFALGTGRQHRPAAGPDARGAGLESQLPSDVRNYGVTVAKSTSSPLIMFALYSPKGTYDNIFLANYAYININDQMTRVKGIASVTVFGAGQYAMRLWVSPDQCWPS
jgi:hypothetical protein